MERDDARVDFFLGALPWWVPTAVEFRHPSWVCDEVFTLLERHQTAYVVMSGAGLSCVLRATAPTVHLRLHGPDDQWLYSGSYPDEDLRWGPTASETGSPSGVRCTPPSTTTQTGTLCATPGRSAHS
jgi:uncharacterized protein YecE (DUF72 family)